MPANIWRRWFCKDCKKKWGQQGKAIKCSECKSENIELDWEPEEPRTGKGSLD